MYLPLERVMQIIEKKCATCEISNNEILRNDRLCPHFKRECKTWEREGK